MHQDAVPEIAGADHPPVEDDAGDESDVPEGAVLDGKEGGDEPEGLGRIRAERDAGEVFRIDQPAHQPAAPEKLFKNRDRDDADRNAEKKKYGIIFRARRRGAYGMAGDWVIEQDEMMPA